MKMQDTRTCVVCGTQFLVANGFCPICMLREALDEEVKSGMSSLEQPEQARAELMRERRAQRYDHYELVMGEDGKPVELGPVEWDGRLWQRSIERFKAFMVPE
jgi:hypothetical protein